MSDDSLIPISDEQAKAVQEVAKFFSKVVDSGGGIGRYLDRVFGRVPDNLVGYLIGDWLAEHRLRRAERLRAETEEIRRQRGTSEQAEVSLSVAIPLIQAAIDEDREGLRQIWARLLAAAMDPARTHLVRLAFIDAVKHMDPLDAAVLQALQGPTHAGKITGALRNSVVEQLGSTPDEFDVSVENLAKLGLVRIKHPAEGTITAFGREFLRTVSD
jgi:hypothetical protein